MFMNEVPGILSLHVIFSFWDLHIQGIMPVFFAWSGCKVMMVYKKNHLKAQLLIPDKN